MRLTRNEPFTYRGKFDCPCCCRLRLWEEKGSPPVVVFSQLPDYYGPSITNRIEWLAWEIWEQLGFAEGMIVLQHYPDRGPWRNGRPSFPSRVHAVTFSPDWRDGFSDPRWNLLSREEVAALPGKPLQD